MNVVLTVLEPPARVVPASLQDPVVFSARVSIADFSS